jgi:hypothetical protein
MRVALSSELIRRNISLASGSPGTIDRRPPRNSILAVDSMSRRIFVFRFAASGPWQVKHLSEKIGRMSRLKSAPARTVRVESNKSTSSGADGLIIKRCQWLKQVNNITLDRIQRLSELVGVLSTRNLFLEIWPARRPQISHAVQAAALLLADLSVTKPHSRPYTSDDDPSAESRFRIMKYRPAFPDRFGAFRTAVLFARSSSPCTTTALVTLESAGWLPP